MRRQAVRGKRLPVGREQGVMKREELKTKALYDLARSIAAELLRQKEYPWEVLPEIGDFIRQIGPELSKEEYEQIGADIWIHRSVKIPPTASLLGPLILCEGVEVRQCAFFRGNVIIGRDSVAGNSCEFKNSILFDHVETPHYNYIGDSILGYRSHMGAGAVTSNIKSDRKNILIHADDGEMETGLRKIGALLADGVEVGCGSVLNPGTVVGRHTNIYPLSSVRGTVPADSIYKDAKHIVRREDTGGISCNSRTTVLR